MESEPDRGRASLLTTARLAPWCSSHPLSSEDEPARRLAPAGNRAALRGGFRILRLPLPPACSHRAGEQRLERELARWQAPPRKRLAAEAVGVGTSSFLEMDRKPAGRQAPA